MYCESTIPKDALVTYQYVEVPSTYHDKRPDFFYGNLDEYPERPNLFSDPLEDPYRKHSKSYDTNGFFCVNAENDISHLGLSPVTWPTLIAGARINLVCGAGGSLSPHPAEIPPDYPSKLYSDPEYGDFRRAIHVFALEGKTDQVIIINDGMAYHLTNASERIDRLKKEGKIPENCAVIFVSTLPGLKKDHELVDASSNLQGMGERTIDYCDHVDEYADFLTKQLFPYLKERGIAIPDDPAKRTLVGSSLSGTASLYLGLKYPERFGKVVAQSPSPTNRDLIEGLDNLEQRASKIAIELSCGLFEEADNYAKNGNLEFMRILAGSLNVEGYEGLHGHQFEAWAFDLERSLPAICS
jgi:enterochelin esterase-like enzyme